MPPLTAASLMAPSSRHQAPWFAFLVHFRDRQDLDVLNATATLSETQRDRILTAPPLVISTLRFRDSPALGDIILIPRLSDDVIFSAGRALIAQAVEIAANRGAKVVGLGGLTAPATRGGTALVGTVPRGMTLTTGNALTAAVARANVREACALLRRRRPTVAVLGSTGSVGTALSSLLAEDDIELVLMGRSTERAKRTAPDLLDRVDFSSDLADVNQADVIVTLTSDRSARLRPELFDARQPRVVIDVAQPPNVAYGDHAALRASQVHVAKGGWVQLPGVTSSHATDLFVRADDASAPADSAPACVAETWLMAVEGIRRHAVGPADTVLARRLERAAERRGVRTRPLALDAETVRATPSGDV